MKAIDPRMLFTDVAKPKSTPSFKSSQPLRGCFLHCCCCMSRRQLLNPLNMSKSCAAPGGPRRRLRTTVSCRIRRGSLFPPHWEQLLNNSGCHFGPSTWRGNVKILHCCILSLPHNSLFSALCHHLYLLLFCKACIPLGAGERMWHQICK